jgi:hypothetical protein
MEPPMRLALIRQLAVDVFADRMQDGHIHYGLLFAVPTGMTCEAAQKHSDLDTRSRHGKVENWWLGVPCASLPAGHAALLIPRTWLVRQGYLPLWVLLLPARRFAMRRVDDLRRHVWLEWPSRIADDAQRATVAIEAQAA